MASSRVADLDDKTYEESPNGAFSCFCNQNKSFPEMSDSHRIDIECADNNPIDYYNAIATEWFRNTSGHEGIPYLQRRRKIEKVPQLLLSGRKNSKNREYYEPAVISLGPYHHNKDELREAEKYKLITLQLYVANTGRTIDYFHDQVFKVIHAARRCYIEGSTDVYDDQQFAQMMLRDACFILFYIESLALKDIKLILHNEYLGSLGFANILRDIFLLENQIPFVILEVMMNFKYQDKGELILNRFFTYLNYGEVKARKKKVLQDKNIKQPLHLLELYRAYFISIPCSGPSSWQSTSGRWIFTTPEDNMDDNFNYVKVNRSLSSLRELKAKGIFLKPTSMESTEDIKFHSNCYYGELELPLRAVSPNSKAIYLNMIAYEICPHNPNDFRVSTYIRFMKSLIVHPDDVKELRTNNILIHSLGRDEEVVKMYQEIDTLAVNTFMFSKLKRGIEQHCKSLYKTWTAELISLYFSKPWRAVALLVAAAILVSSVLQTVFTIWPCLPKV